MDISPGVPNKRIQLGFPSPLNLSPSVSPLMGNSPLQHSFSTRSRKSSSTQSESTPLSSPSSLAQVTNPFAINYDSGNCEHWQSNSGSGSNCSSPSIHHTGGGGGSGYKGLPAEGLSFGSPFKAPGTNNAIGGIGSLQEEGGQINSLASQVNSGGIHHHHHHHHPRVFSLSPSPSGSTSGNDDQSRGSGEGVAVSQAFEVSLPTPLDAMTETPTPLSPKGLQFRQKLFPPQNLPSPIPRPLPHSIPSTSYSSPSCSSGPLRGGRIATPMSPKSSHLNHHQSHSSASSLQHDKHLSPFKADLAASRMIRAVACKKRRTFHMDSVRSPPNMGGSGTAGVGVGGASGDHLSSWLSSHHSQASNRQTISSPLATLSMSSNLEDSSNSSGNSGPLRLSSVKRKLNDSSSVVAPSEDEPMDNGSERESPAMNLMDEGLIPTAQ